MIELFEPLTVSPMGEIFVSVLGLLWGSFFNVCIYRLPLDMDIVVGSSFCPRCEKPIPWFCNVPVFGYIFLRGRCYQCKGRISLQYPLVEIASAVLFLWVYLNFGWSWKFLFYTVFVSSLLVLSVIDYWHKIIPDEISLSGILVGFIAVLVTGSIPWWHSLLGILLGGGSFFLVAYTYEKLAKREGLGGGDVKLLGMIGAWLGYKSVFPVILISSALGSMVGIGLMLLQGRNFKSAIPFGPFLALAAFIYLFWGGWIDNFLFPPVYPPFK